jgi:hypothetical protein
MSTIRLISMFVTFMLGAVLAGCSGDGASAAADYRGDALCATAQASAAGTSCDLSVTMHGHTYRLTCDFSQGSCDCFRDSHKVPGGNAFGGTITPMCTVDFFDLEWADCCGTPE